MATWGKVMQERQVLLAQGAGTNSDNILRDKYLAALSAHTHRETILYGTKWTHPLMQGIPPDLLTITEEDLQGMMEVVHGLSGPNLDLILHSPGGSAVAAEAIVLY